MAWLLGNERIDTDAVMAPFAREVLQRACTEGQRLVLIMDQTRANDTQLAVVVAVRVGGRGAEVAAANAKIVLMGDRVYGSPDLIAWCRRQGFKRGLRRIQTCLHNLCGLPGLWSVWRN